jgi:branched-chain amino acid transport system ATP-binding protein
MLEVSNLHAAYGAVQALENVDLEVGPKQIVCLLGARHRSCSRGSAAVEKIVARDIIQVPEGREIFPTLTVEDNVALGSWLYRREKQISADFDRVYDLFPLLAERSRQQAGTLSGGEQQMLMIGRALMARPRLLMFDEPSLGLSPILVDQVFEIIKRINASGTPILLVEQNARIALKLSSYGYIMENGEIKFHGEAAMLAKNPRVREAYLGGKDLHMKSH